MSLFQAASLSADAVTNGLAHLLIAVFLKCALEEDVETRAGGFCLYSCGFNRPLILTLSLLLALSKQLYLPFLGLFFWVPVKKFGNFKTYLLTFSALLLICLTAVLSWSSTVKDLYAFNPTGSQISFILSHPLNFASILLNTLSVRGYDYLQEFIGKLGWLDTPLPAFHIWSYIAMLGIFALADSNNNVALTGGAKVGAGSPKMSLRSSDVSKPAPTNGGGTKALLQTGAKALLQTGAKALLQTGAKALLQTGAKALLQTVGLKPNYKRLTGIQKALAFSIFTFNSLLMFILMYLSWNPVGAPVIEGIQGRYFIPLAPLFFLLISNQTFHLTIKRPQLFAVCYSLFSATLTVAVLLKRYYL